MSTFWIAFLAVFVGIPLLAGLLIYWGWQGKKTTPTTPPTQAQPAPVAQPKKKASTGRGGRIGVLLTLIALVIAAWIWWPEVEQGAERVADSIERSFAPTQPKQSSSTRTTTQEYALVITAPVGQWSQEVHVPVGRCTLWTPMPSNETFRVQVYWDGAWADATGTKDNASHVRIQSRTASPITVTLKFQPIGTC